MKMVTCSTRWSSNQYIWILTFPMCLSLTCPISSLNVPFHYRPHWLPGFVQDTTQAPPWVPSHPELQSICLLCSSRQPHQTFSIFPFCPGNPISPYSIRQAAYTTFRSNWSTSHSQSLPCLPHYCVSQYSSVPLDYLVVHTSNGYIVFSFFAWLPESPCILLAPESSGLSVGTKSELR